MSAFVCSDRHLAALVRAWISFGNRAIMSDRILNTDDADAWDGAMAALWTANERSVCHRYNEPMPAPEMAPRYRESQAPVVVGLALVKLCDCFDYQSMEHPDYEGSDVARLVNDIRTAAVRAMPGYREAAWSI